VWAPPSIILTTTGLRKHKKPDACSHTQGVLQDFSGELQFETDVSHLWKFSMMDSGDPAHFHFSCFVFGSIKLMKK
jgi:hypothetical protein